MQYKDLPILASVPESFAKISSLNNKNICSEDAGKTVVDERTGVSLDEMLH